MEPFGRLAIVMLLSAVPAFAAADPVPAPPPPVNGSAYTVTPAAMVPAGTRLRFHLLQPLSSNLSKSGQSFSFALLDPIDVDGHTLVAGGAVGSGTVILAGPSGSAGHEGDLTLRLDSLAAPADTGVTFDDQRLEMNGHNRKVESGVLGLTPFAGIFARLIRGADIQVDTTTPIETVLVRPASVASAASPEPSPQPT